MTPRGAGKAWLVLVVLAGACGKSSSATTPTPTPTLNLSGVWDFTSTLTSGTSGLTECVGQHAIGEQGIAVVTIQDTNGSLTATAANPGNGQSCSYTGTRTDTQFFVQLSTCSFTANRLPCAVNTYDFRPSQGSYTGSATASRITGTGASSENVYLLPAPGLPQLFNAQVATNTFQTTFVMTKR